jgi:hypothetical protein
VGPFQLTDEELFFVWNGPQWTELKRAGVRVVDRLRGTKAFRNPDFLESVVSHFEIDERATMFAKDAFDPSDDAYAPEDFYDALAAAHKKQHERREKEKKSRGWADRNVAFVRGGGGGGVGDGERDGGRAAG